MSALVAGGVERSEGMELPRMLATLIWIVGATVASLAALGAVPRWLVGESSALRRVATVEEAERRLAARLLVPGYYPSRLGWPPSVVEVAGGRRGSALLVFPARDGGPDVELLQATSEGEPIAAELLEGRTVLRSDRATVEHRPAQLSDVLVNGRRERELAWEIQGRAMVLRSAGDLEELFRMARSAHREGGR